MEQAMSDSPSLGFGKFVPGFDFLQNLAKGATHCACPAAAGNPRAAMGSAAPVGTPSKTGVSDELC